MVRWRCSFFVTMLAWRYSMKLPLWAAVLFLPLPTLAQEAAVPVSQEPHHHLVLENSYVRAYYVEVAPHDSTLQHRHDLPYFSVLLSGGPAASSPAPARSQQQPEEPRVIYSTGGISHKVGNPAEVPFTNVTVELLRPQGKARNRCTEVVQGQPLERCDIPSGVSPSSSSRYTVFETGEILVEYWKIDANFSERPWDHNQALLLIALDATALWAADASPNAGSSSLLWFDAGSKVLLKIPPDRHSGHFFAIFFKDSAPAQR